MLYKKLLFFYVNLFIGYVLPKFGQITLSNAFFWKSFVSASDRQCGLWVITVWINMQNTPFRKLSQWVFRRTHLVFNVLTKLGIDPVIK